MQKRTYVSDIYQWIIDDVITKVRVEFIRYGINDLILLELAEKWEYRILSMKICEVPNGNIKLPHLYLNAFVQDKALFSSENRLTSHTNTVPISPEWQLKQYQNAVGLLSRQFVKIPANRPNDHEYFFFLCQQYLTAIEDLQTQIRALDAPIKKVDHFFPYSTTTTKTVMDSQQNTPYPKIMNGVENVCKYTKNIALAQKETFTQQSIDKKSLDREELSDFSASDSEVSDVADTHMNRIDCCYTQIKRRKTGQQTRWLNKVKNGIMLINGREYLFRDALVKI